MLRGAAALGFVCLLVQACAGSNLGFSGVQDIGQFRAIVEAGGIPGPSTLDANGFFSEHTLELPAADCGQPICLQGLLAAQRDWLYDRRQTVLQVAFNTPLKPDDLQPRPRDVVAVIDVSRSMADDHRLEHLVAGLHRLIDALDSQDRLGLVSFSREARVVAELTAATEAAALHAAVDGLSADGSTNLHDGLQLGLQMALDGSSAEHQSLVILLSDGAPTRGVTDGRTILFMASAYTQQGLRLSTVGVGVDADLGLLKQLAELGGGTFYFVEKAETVEAVFSEELSLIVQPLAFDLLLDILPAPGYRIREILGAPRSWVDETSSLVRVPALFLTGRRESGGERRGGGASLFFSLEPAGATAPAGPSDVARLQFSYRTDPDPAAARTSQTATVTAPYAPGEIPDETWVSHPAAAKGAAMLGLFLGLREVTMLSPDCAAWAVQRLVDRTESWLQSHTDADIAADLALVKKLEQNLRRVLELSGSDIFVPKPPVLPGFCPLEIMACGAAAGSAAQAPGRGGWALAWFLLLLGISRLGWLRRRTAARILLPALALALLLAGCELPLRESDVVEGLPAAVAVSAGSYHDCVLDEPGQLWCWGSLYDEDNGDPKVVRRWPPLRVEGLDTVVQISSDRLRLCARTADQALWCWGQPPVGDDTMRVRPRPTRVVDLDGGLDVAAGLNRSCAVDLHGGVWCWGVVPLPLELPEPALRVSAGQGGHGCAVTTSGAVWCWGNNYYGQLGDGTWNQPGDTFTPVQVKGLSRTRAVVACPYHSCALTDDGRVWCWGNNTSGQCGWGSLQESPLPREVPGLTEAVEIACGNLHTCALTAGGLVFCWGNNEWGQLGDGTTTSRRRPVRVYDVADAVGLSAAEYHTCAVLAGGALHCWGDHPYRQVLQSAGSR